MGALPHVSAVSLARQLWAGSFGAHGLTAHVPEDRVVVGEATLGAGDHRAGLILKAEGVIRDPGAGGEDVGRFKHRLTKDSAGHLVGYYDLVDLAENRQGSGFARGFHNQAVAGLQRLGADRIETLATDVGGYTWARFGFDYAVEGVDELARTTAKAVEARMAVEMSHAFSEISGVEYASLAPHLIGDGELWRPGILASTQDLLRLEGTLGKRILLGSGWQGILRLR